MGKTNGGKMTERDLLIDINDKINVVQSELSGVKSMLDMKLPTLATKDYTSLLVKDHALECHMRKNAPLTPKLKALVAGSIVTIAGAAAALMQLIS
jgi:hypothetical protein